MLLSGPRMILRTIQSSFALAVRTWASKSSTITRTFASSTARSAIILPVIWKILSSIRRCIRASLLTFPVPIVQRVSIWRLGCEVTCLCTQTTRTLGCDECAAKFKRKDNLKVHMKIHLPADIRAAEKVQKLTKECETCGKKFETNWKLKRHMVVHTKDIGKAEVVAEEQMFFVMNDAKFESVQH